MVIPSGTLPPLAPAFPGPSGRGSLCRVRSFGMTLPCTVCGLCFRAIRLTRLVHVPIATMASNMPPDATIVRPCLRMNLDLCENSANGVAIRFRSSSDICTRSISRSVRTFSSTPRNAHSIYQSQATRRTIREKKSIHSSMDGIDALASRTGGGGSAFDRKRGSSGTSLRSSPVSKPKSCGGSIGTSNAN